MASPPLPFIHIETNLRIVVDASCALAACISSAFSIDAQMLRAVDASVLASTKRTMYFMGINMRCMISYYPTDPPILFLMDVGAGRADTYTHLNTHYTVYFLTSSLCVSAHLAL